MRKTLSLILLLSLALQVRAQESLVSSGPMPGYSTMQEVAIWVQTRAEAKVQIAYWSERNPDLRRWTKALDTRSENAYTATLIADSLRPGTNYQYALYINDTYVKRPYETTFQTQKIWKWRGDAPDFSFATGSCAYINEEVYDRPGKPYGGEYEIFRSIVKQKPDFMLWLGDNVYLREPDWNSKTGIYHRYTHDRAIPEIQALLGSVHHYAIWDDHDYGPNNSDRGWWNKETTLAAFKDFWANPSYGREDVPGVFTFFQWADVDFILLDNRYYRSPDQLEASGKTMLGGEQLQWLFDNLVASDASFKVVALGSQFLNNSGVGETYFNDGFANERQQIIDFIHNQNIKNVIFISGDKHFSELSKLEEPGEEVIYDLTISPFTAGVNTFGAEENNTLRIQGSMLTDRNFGIVNVHGPLEERKFTIKVFDTEGLKVWEYTILKQ